MWQPLQFNSNVSSHLHRCSLCSSSTFFFSFAEMVNQWYSMILFLWTHVLPYLRTWWRKLCFIQEWVEVSCNYFWACLQMRNVFFITWSLYLSEAQNIVSRSIYPALFPSMLLLSFPSFRLISCDFYNFFSLASDLYMLYMYNEFWEIL